MEDTLGPTPEWMRKHTYEPPAKDRETNRAAYRRVSTFESLHNRGDIEYCHLRAAERLAQHVEGSMGYDVRILDPWETSGGSAGDEFPRTRHAAELKAALALINPKEAEAIHALLWGLDTLEGLGRRLTNVGKREIARARGLGLIVGGLERLAYHWDFISKKERV